MENNPTKPGRPFGITVAIIATVVLYSFIPLLQLGMVLLVEQHFQNLDQTIMLPNGEETTAFATGGNFRGDLSDARLILQGILAVSFLIVAYFAWKGRPSQMRWVFVSAVILLTAITLGLTVIPGFTDRNKTFSGGSLDVLSIPLLCLQFGAIILVPLYVIWYLNRAPARAFYRGSYLEQKPITESTG